MVQVRLHVAERDRLDSLDSYDVLDSAPEPTYAAITTLAARVCRTPIAAVSLVDRDRQWFKSIQGLDISETPRSMSFCSDVVADSAALVVTDTTLSGRYRDNPLVTGEPYLRAYAGVPLVGRDGLPLGTLCVLDQRPRRFTDAQLEQLQALGGQVVTLLEQRRRDRLDGLLSEGVLQQALDAVRLRRALDDGELVPHYQPVVDIATGQVQSLEALLRWEHPELGTLPPGAFLPAVEASALVVPVGRAVLEHALGVVAQANRAGLALPGGVAVNVASGQLARPGLAREVLSALRRHRVPSSQLSLEITEATNFPDAELAHHELTALAESGVRIVIDDFGVGWSNLSRVLQLPVHALKLDRSIASAVLVDPRAAAMARSTAALAADLGLHVVVEGVETEPVRAHLASIGCHWAQGWLFSPAVPALSVWRLLRHPPRDLRATWPHGPPRSAVPIRAVPPQTRLRTGTLASR